MGQAASWTNGQWRTRRMHVVPARQCPNGENGHGAVSASGKESSNHPLYGLLAASSHATPVRSSILYHEQGEFLLAVGHVC